MKQCYNVAAILLFVTSTSVVIDIFPGGMPNAEVYTEVQGLAPRS